MVVYEMDVENYKVVGWLYLVILVYSIVFCLICINCYGYKIVSI